MSKTENLRKAALETLRNIESTPAQIAQAALVKGVDISALIAAYKRLRAKAAK